MTTEDADWPEPARPSLHAELRSYLTARRRELGLTQGQLAERMGTTQSAVSELENTPRCNPTLETLARWSAGLGLDLSVQVTERVHRAFTVT
jgi:transcriptional regulator with XRE-family HTH domain